MSRGLGRQQRAALRAMARLEAEYGPVRWFFCHSLIRMAGPGKPAEDVDLTSLRPRGVERRINPTRVLNELARRQMIRRNARCGPGASVSLSDAGREWVARSGL